MITDVDIPAGDQRSWRGRLALPDGAGPHPAVLVLHDVLGFTEDLDRIALRFAEQGYVALAPDMLAGGSGPICIVKTIRSLAGRSGPAFDVLEDAQAWLAARDDVEAGRTGVVGFCMGGGFALAHAVRADVSFVAAFYGEVAKDQSDLDGMAPCFAGYGKRDLLFIRDGRRLQNHLQSLDVSHDVRVYDGVGHSYMNQLTGFLGAAARFTPMRARYDETAAEDSWTAMLDFFAANMP